jgi:hypothetical protein
LVLITGVTDSLSTTLLAVGLLAVEDEESYCWLFEQVRKHVGEEAWKSVRAVGADGDRAVLLAIKSRLPDALVVRCIWHLQQNALRRLRAPLGVEYDAFMRAFIAAAYCTTQADFEQARSISSCMFPRQLEVLTLTRFVFFSSDVGGTARQVSTPRSPGVHDRDRQLRRVIRLVLHLYPPYVRVPHDTADGVDA